MLEDKKAYKQVRWAYHNKLEFRKKYLKKKIDKFKDNRKKHFDLMYYIIGKV